jgi:hypothetical protein
LADHFTALAYDAIPNKHVRDAKTLVLDWLAVVGSLEAASGVGDVTRLAAPKGR